MLSLSHFQRAIAALVLIPTAALSQAQPTTSADSARAAASRPAVLEAVTVTATRTATAVRNVAASVLVIDSLRIRSQLGNGVADLLRSEPGVDVVGTGVNQARPAIRGQRGQRILLLQDGMRLNNSRRQQDFGEITSLVDANELARVEVVRGPASVLYGTDAIGGVVNLITRAPNLGGPTRMSGRMGYQYGSAGALSKTTATTSTNQCTIVGLTNGTAYTFSVVAKNGVGTSAAATVSQSLTPATTPSAPQSATAAASNDQITVSWSAPKSTGGSPVTKYVASDGTSQCTVVPSSPGVTPPTALTCNLLGAMPGGTYAISVWAFNDIGRSPAASLTSVFVTTPSAPQGVLASTANSQTTITWETPLSNGGGAILSYVVTDFNGHSCTVASTARSCTITGLTNGLVYNFAIDATNIQGQGNFANVVVVPSTAPTSPLGVTAVAGDTRATVSWTDEQFPENGGAPIATYVVTAVGNAALTCTLVYTYGATTQCTVLGLTNGVSYSFTVVASNAAGRSPASAPSNSVVPFSSIPVG